MKAPEIIEEINNTKTKIEFLPTGLDRLDNDIDGGFTRKELIVLGGFTGLGKSYLSSQIMYNIAQQGFKTAYFSLEITNKMIVSRLLGQEANVKSIKIVTGTLTDGQHEKVVKAEAMLEGYGEFMDFYDEIYEFDKITECIKKNNYDFIVIDFIQNVITSSSDEYSRLSMVALQLQKLAKEKNCCIMVLSQLSNQAAKTDSSQLEYKGSGSIAMVCDLGFILQRDFALNTLTLILKKNRRGPSGIAWQFQFFEEGGKII